MERKFCQTKVLLLTSNIQNMFLKMSTLAFPSYFPNNSDLASSELLFFVKSYHVGSVNEICDHVSVHLHFLEECMKL